MRAEIVDSELLTHLARFYPSTCTIQIYTDENKDSYGQPQPIWIDFPFYVGIPCAIAGAGGKEMKRADMTIAVATHTVVLAGNYPFIKPKMRAVIDSQIYDILLVEVDSHSKMTRLICQRVNVQTDIRLLLPMHEGSGSKVYDHSSYGNDGVIYGATWTQLANGLWVPSFDGTDDYIHIPHDASLDVSLNVSGAFTICAFVFSTLPTNGEYFYITTKGSWKAGAYVLEKWFDSDFGNFAIYDLTPNQVRGTTPLNDGHWHHVCGIYDGDYIYFYTDGELDDSVAVTGSLSSNVEDFWIGCYPPAPTYWFPGLISELRIYNRALTAAEIQQLYLSTKEQFL